MTIAKQFIDEFIQLAMYRLLLISDLSIYHSAIKSTLSFEEKMSSSRPSPMLSLFSTMNRCCESHIRERLYAICKNKPIKLHDKSFDTIKKLVASCQYFGLDFNRIRDQELLVSIHLYLFNKPKDYSFFYEHQKEFGLTQEVIYGKIIGLRLDAIFWNKPYYVNGVRDNLDYIRMAIIEKSSELFVSPINLQGLALEYFLKRLLEELQIKMKSESEPASVEYQKIISIIKRAVADSNPWLDVFQSVLAVASSTRESEFKESYIEAKSDGVSHKRPKLSSSSHTYFSSSHGTWYDFCKRLTTLSELTNHTYAYHLHSWF
jgi:hypothetical protein